MGSQSSSQWTELKPIAQDTNKVHKQWYNKRQEETTNNKHIQKQKQVNKTIAHNNMKEADKYK
jgi:hypothetical protein